VNHERLKEAFLQGGEREAAELFREMMKGAVRLGLLEAMAEEVDVLCGPRYRPDPNCACHRAGSERGVAFLDGGKEEIRRPRVRHETEGEVRLATYEAASSPQGMFDQVVAAVAQGMPLRGVERAMKGALSKSEASRMWVEKSREQLALLRERRLDDTDWLALLIDGVWLTRELCVVIAVGIDAEGNKRVLDFGVGSSESAAVVASLLDGLEKRGFAPGSGRRLLVLRDGSAAIEKAVSRRWPDSVRQECLVHAQSNLREKVRQRDRADIDRLFKTLREAQGLEAGEECFEELLEFVSERNAAAAVALKERRGALLAFHRLDVPATLNTTFLSTNLIENVIRNWRAQSGNVKRWNEKADMVPRWMASGLLWAEAGFRKVRHAGDLPSLASALSLYAPSSVAADAAPSSSAPSDNAGQKQACQKATNR
jgi:transposase-like protein